MEKIKYVGPERIQVNGNNVIVNNKTFEQIILAINLQADYINKLIDEVERLGSHLTIAEQDIESLKNATKALANALRVYNTED